MAHINGEHHPEAVGTTIAQYLTEADYNPTVIVVERNEEILPKDRYDTTAIAEGDTIEIVMFMGGG